jgi:putative effector of murein hydrolase LrgA (UPF0299 family)
LEQTQKLRQRGLLELGVIVVSICLICSLAANYAVAFMLDIFRTVAYPYLPEGILLGIGLMTVASLIAFLTRKPLLVATLTTLTFIFFFAWSADLFFAWSEKGVRMVTNLLPFAILLPFLSVFGAWKGLKLLGR